MPSEDNVRPPTAAAEVDAQAEIDVAAEVVAEAEPGDGIPDNHPGNGESPLGAVAASEHPATASPVDDSGDAAEPVDAVADANDDEPRLRAVMVLVHGVPRAAAALSLQRHLAGLAYIDGVEAREYAEGILRLQVTAHRPLDLADLRAWDGGADLAPVHVQDDVIEVRLPGAQGF